MNKTSDEEVKALETMEKCIETFKFLAVRQGYRYRRMLKLFYKRMFVEQGWGFVGSCGRIVVGRGSASGSAEKDEDVDGRSNSGCDADELRTIAPYLQTKDSREQQHRPVFSCLHLLPP